MLQHAKHIAMGVQELWKECLPGVKSKPALHFKTAQNTRIAIDVSCLLHASICKPKNALLVTCVPPCPPKDVISTLEANHESFVKNGINPCYVFDGCQHPMKAATLAGRDLERKKALCILKSFYERGKQTNEILTDNDHSLAMKNVKKIASRTNELTHVVIEWMVAANLDYACAPFEAEWQCVCL